MFLFKRKLSKERQQQLHSFQKKAGLRFKNLSLLDRALVHRSAVKSHTESNERLEFLGDSVLGLVVADDVFRYFPHSNEGELARIKAATVSEDSLAELALALHVADYLILGKGEIMSGGKAKKALLADALEAIIGAVYLDAGFQQTKNFVSRILKKQITLVSKHACYEDFKSALQELAQQNFKLLPKYTLEKTEGPDHDLRFWVSVTVNGHSFGPCIGKTKKDAEQEAAALAVKNLQNSSEP